MSVCVTSHERPRTGKVQKLDHGTCTHGYLSDRATSAQEKTLSLPKLFESMQWTDESSNWTDEADLDRAIKYARGSKRLKLPVEWREVLPCAL